MDSKPLCRLCVEEIEPLLDVFGNFGTDAQIAQLIALHFWFEIKKDDPLSDKICTNCWSKLVDFHAFYSQIQKAQDRITMVVIETLPEAKSNEDEFDYDMKHEIVLSQEEFDAAVKLEACNGNNQTGSEQTGSYIANPGVIIQHGTANNSRHQTAELTISVSPDNSKTQVLTLDIEMEDSNNEEASNDESQPLPVPESAEDSQASSADSTPPKRYRKLKKYQGRTKLVRTTTDTVRKICTRAQRARNLRSYPENKAIKKESSEVQKAKEIELIESYFKMECDLCHKVLGNFVLLFDHYRDEHQFRGYVTCCGRKFFRQPVIAEHVLWHVQPEDFTCKTCDKVFINKRSYDSHMLTHAPPDVQIYQCEHCAKTFAKKFKLAKHKLSHLKDEEKVHICDECDKPYATEALLRAHKRVVHQQSYAHMCEICARVFKSRVFFEKHQLEHLGQNLPKVQCQICNAWMKNEHTMRAHMRNHQDEGREHQCDICGKKGPSRNAIAKHKRFVHLSERKFKCDLCEKAFKRAITLKEHITVHTGEILYRCTFCGKTFNSGANMHAHRKKAHPLEWAEEKQTKLESMKPNDSSSS